MEFLHGPDHERAVRTGAAEERDVVARLGHDVRSADQLTAGRADAGLERTGEQRDHVALGCLESSARRVDAQDAAPQARGPRWALGPALLASAERADGQRAAGAGEQ